MHKKSILKHYKPKTWSWKLTWLTLLTLTSLRPAHLLKQTSKYTKLSNSLKIQIWNIGIRKLKHKVNYNSVEFWNQIMNRKNISRVWETQSRDGSWASTGSVNTHSLAIETGRHRKSWLPWEQRVCVHCRTGQKDTLPPSLSYSSIRDLHFSKFTNLIKNLHPWLK